MIRAAFEILLLRIVVISHVDDSLIRLVVAPRRFYIEKHLGGRTAAGVDTGTVPSLPGGPVTQVVNAERPRGKERIQSNVIICIRASSRDEAVPFLIDVGEDDDSRDAVSDLYLRVVEEGGIVPHEAVEMGPPLFQLLTAPP